jgi:ribosomal protein S18 acetylase RimI-like enzyme
VRPDARRRGFGRALLGALRERTDGRVEWSVLDWNEQAQAFYRSLGAAPVDGWTTWRWMPPR